LYYDSKIRTGYENYKRKHLNIILSVTEHEHRLQIGCVTNMCKKCIKFCHQFIKYGSKQRNNVVFVWVGRTTLNKLTMST